jgi:lysozyme
MTDDRLLFGFLRRKLGGSLEQAEVDEYNAVLRAWKQANGLSPVNAPGTSVTGAGPGTAGRPGSAPGAPSAPAGGGISAFTKRGPLTAIVGVVAATSLFATIPKDEGIEYKAYRDIAGIWTICAGDTANVRAGMIETPEGCRQRLERQLVAHAAPVMACSPRLREPGRDWQRAAAVSLAYNIGVGAYCRSTVDRRFDAGDIRGACNGFMAWNKARVNGQLRPVLGLTRRREREREICLRGVTA